MKYLILIAILLPALLATSCRPQTRFYHGRVDSTNGTVRFIFPDLNGPDTASHIAPEVRTSFTAYSGGSASRFCILLTDTNSNWLPLAHGLKSIGIPFSITTSPDVAFQHRAVLIYPSLDQAPADLIQKLKSALAESKTIIAENVTDPALASVFGFKRATSTKLHRTAHILNDLATRAGFTEPEELTIPFASPTDTELYHWSTSYEPAGAAALMEYEDRTPAMIEMRAGAGGSAIALGIDIGYLMRLGFENRDEDIPRSYVNQYEPAIDVCLRILKSIYERAEPNAVTFWPVPDNKGIAVLMTHDIDYQLSIRNAIQYAKLENQFGIPATYFVQAKYIKDYNDIAFLDDSGELNLRELDSMGMEIASHSVSHSHEFASFPLGTGTEKYPEYSPFVWDTKVTKGGTIFGELRASKFIVEKLSRQHITSFRPGYLANPYQLPEALAATGYSYSSSVTANNSLTHLPFQLSYGREGHDELPVFSFPITIEDREKPPMDQRLGAAIALSHKLAKYGGCFCILLHPDKFDYKWRFEQGLVPAVKSYSWFGTVRSYGDFWAARNKAECDVSDNGTRPTVTITAPIAISGLTLALPNDWKLASTQPATERAKQSGNRLTLTHLSGTATLAFTKQPTQ